jgi:hypothetical protein
MDRVSELRSSGNPDIPKTPLEASGAVWACTRITGKNNPNKTIRPTGQQAVARAVA